VRLVWQPSGNGYGTVFDFWAGTSGHLWASTVLPIANQRILQGGTDENCSHGVIGRRCVDGRHDLEIAAAIPDSALRWAPNDEVRDFAEMVEHYANNLWLSQFALGIEHESVGDSAQYLNDNAALGDVVTQWYDMVIADLREVPADDFFTEVDFFGDQRMQKWQVYSFGLQHALWTRGGLIPYFRAHGVPVPAFRGY
jgi:hypothetical protein